MCDCLTVLYFSPKKFTNENSTKSLKLMLTDCYFGDQIHQSYYFYVGFQLRALFREKLKR